MAILDDEPKSRSSSADGMPKVEATPPPPPPRGMQYLSILLALLGLGSAFLRSWSFCTVFTGLLVIAGIAAVIGLRAWQDGLGKRASDGMPILRIPPPPPPPLQQILMILLPLLALGAVLFRSWGLSLTFTALTVALDLAVLASVRSWSANAEKAAAGQTPAG